MKDKPVILVVDDQPHNIELLEAHLVPQGYEIVGAANGKEALEKLSGYQIDLILLDVIMPGMDDFEVIRRVRQDNTHRLLPIILVTALLETILPEKAAFDNYEVEHDFAIIGGRIMLLNARQVKSMLGKERIILLAFEDITERKRVEAALEEEHRQVQQAFHEVRTLRGISPICAYCKKIRDDKGYWSQVEKYISDHTDAKFSHGVRPACFEREMKCET